jgi:hypothetical protein
MIDLLDPAIKIIGYLASGDDETVTMFVSKYPHLHTILVNNVLPKDLEGINNLQMKEVLSLVKHCLWTLSNYAGSSAEIL